MDSSFSFDKLSNHDKYKSSKKLHERKRSKDIYLHNKRERSSSSKNLKEGNQKSNKENRSKNKLYSYGQYERETDYRENKYKYKPIDLKIHVYPNKYSKQNCSKYSKDKYSIDKKQYNLQRKTYSSSLSKDSRDRDIRKNNHTYSTKNSDYSRERRRNKKDKIKRSHSTSSGNRSNFYKKRKNKKTYNHKYKSSRIKYDDDKSSYEKKYKSYNRKKTRDDKKKRPKSSYHQNKHKNRSRSYSPDRDHSYSRLGYHKNFKNRDDRNNKKKDKNSIRDYSNKSKRKPYYRNCSRSSISDSFSRSQSSSRKDYSFCERSKNSSFSSSSNDSRKNKDAGHYDFKIGNILNNKYKILGLLGDGTFGRCLECLNNENNIKYGIKVIRPVPRYIDSAKYEADIILEILRADNYNQSKIVNMHEYFYFQEKRDTYIALVFEKLGKSLYDFIKENEYKGFSIEHIQGITKQILEGMAFIHERLKIVHTDLKPENILLKNDEVIQIKDKKNWPLNVLFKENKIEKSKSPSTRSYSREKQEDVYYSPKEIDIKIIDFGGATRENERHSEVINTRQYRAPEVILGCCKWNEKSDVWCLACIFSELYTGELLFPTHNNEEHLSLIEKIGGPIPLWMANNSKKEFRRIFDLDFNGVDDRYKVNFHKIYNKRDEVISNYEKLETLEELIAEQHNVFRDFLKSLLIIDPNKRPSCKEALNHEFFKIKF